MASGRGGESTAVRCGGASHMRLRWLALLLVVLSLATGSGAATASIAATGPILDQASLGGAAYKVEIPANWNGTLVLYSHGYVTPGSPNPATDVGDPITGAYLLGQGY